MKQIIRTTIILIIGLIGMIINSPKVEAVQLKLEDLPEGSYVNYSANGYDKWQVLSNASNYVRIISEGSVESLSLYGKEGYTNLETSLNNIVSKYKDSYWAVSSESVTKDDISYMQKAGALNINGNYWINKKDYNDNTSCYYIYTIKGASLEEQNMYKTFRRGCNWKMEQYGPFEYGTRAVVVLKPWVYVEGGEGTRDNPYILQKSTRIDLSARADTENNCMILRWSQQDKVHPWKYQLFQRNVLESEWEEVALIDENEKVNVLSIYPANSSKGKKLGKIVSEYGQGKINIKEVVLSDFNANPTQYLNEAKYDVLVFGFDNKNGPNYGMSDTSGQDLSGAAITPILDFMKNGGSVIFGPDVFLAWRHSQGCHGNKYKAHGNFNSLGSQLGIGTSEMKNRDSDFTNSGSRVLIKKSGNITRYPYIIGDNGSEGDWFDIEQTHTSKAYASNMNRWVGYSESNGSYNYYLLQRNNVAISQMGIGSSVTPQEAKLMINLIIALKQTSTKQDQDYIIRAGSDTAPPDKPGGTIWDLRGDDSKYLFKVYEPKDNGTTYEHCVVGTYGVGTMLPQDIAKAIKNNTALEDNMIKSNITRTTICTGLKGYSYTITQKQDDKDVDSVIDVNVGSQNDVPESYVTAGYVQKGETFITIPSKYINSGYYIHIRAIDGAGNASEIYHMSLTYITKTIELTSQYQGADNLDSRGIANTRGQNQILLQWKVTPNLPFTYKLYERREDKAEYTVIDEDTKMNDSRGGDIAGPEKPIVTIKANTFDSQGVLPLYIDVFAKDRGTTYEHYVIGISKENGEPIWSNTVLNTVTVGTQGFSYVIDDKEDTIPDDTIDDLGRTIDRKYIKKYLHIKAIDYNGNAGETAHVLIDDGYKIPYEELNENPKLYCIQKGQAIPAISKESGIRLTATLEAGEGEYAISEYVESPQDGDVVGRRFVVGTTTNIYGKNPILTYSIGKYFQSGLTPKRQDLKEGNADEKEAYILWYYKENTSLKSEAQESIYSTEISKDNIEAANDTELATEADLYSQYRDRVKYNYEPKYLADKGIDLYWDGELENPYIYVGPFKIDYDRSFAKVGNRDKVEFNYIDSFELFNLDGSKINNKWSFVYTQDRVMREHDEDYKYPYPNEEFYIKLSYTEDIKGISNIVIKYKELVVDSQYTVLEGTYNTVKWTPNRITKNSIDALWCTEVEDTNALVCAHGQKQTHIIGAYFYLTAQIVNPGGNALESQKLLRLEWTKRWYNERVQTVDLSKYINNRTNEDKDDQKYEDEDKKEDKPDKDKDNSFKIGFDVKGNVWNDGNENFTDGLMGKNEEAIKKVIVRAYKVDKKGKRISNKEYAKTYTDKNGYYVFKDLPLYYYDIEFEYDGQTYITTKYMINIDTGASDTVNDYYNNSKGETYAKSSKVKETEKQRQELNDRYAEISKFGAIANSGKETKLEYEETDGKSSLITLDEGFVKEKYAINPTTMSDNLKYPVLEIKELPFATVTKITNQPYVNMGLAEREKTDESLRLDVYETTFSIKGETQSYIHSGKNIRDINSNIEIKNYIQKVNRADYEWRLSQYEEYPEYDQIKDILGEAKDCELNAYVDYMIVIRNAGANDIVRITELVDYFDKSLEYNSSWAVVRNDEETEENNSVNNGRIELSWIKKSKYSKYEEYEDKNDYDEFNKLYTTDLDRPELQIVKGQYLEIHIKFKVLKDENDYIRIDKGDESKKNFSEINGYRTFYNKGNNLVSAGLIDKDSKPGNLNPYKELSAYEDDEDKAPDYKLILDNSLLPDKNGGDNSDSEDKGNRGDDGELINYGNVIEGNVWEDMRKKENEEDKEEADPITLKLKNNQIIADGIRQANEPLINDIKVQLIETFRKTIQNPDGTQEIKEVSIKLKGKEKRTKKIKSLTNLDKNEDSIELDGGYRYIGLSSGLYTVEFTYGDEEQLKNNLKYNGQDYQAILTEDIYGKPEIEEDYSDTEIMFVLDYSNSMSNGKLEKAKEVLKQLIEQLNKKLPKVKIGVVGFNNQATVIGELKQDNTDVINNINQIQQNGETSIASGITKASEQYKNGLNKIMIIVTDGQETVQTNEEVITTLENVADSKDVKISTILTSLSEQIFGTVEAPRRGNLYIINQENDIANTITTGLYNKIIEESAVKKNRSWSKDLEGEESNPKPGTRRYILNTFSTIATEKAELLNIDGIKAMENGVDKDNKIKELADETFMIAHSKEIKLKSNVSKTKAEQINLSLTLRPEVELELTEEITGIQIKLSDGNIIIDTEKGLNKNVMDPGVPGSPISIYMDEEIMQGAQITINYKITVKNTGEIDALENYFASYKDTEEGEATIATFPDVINSYINGNLIYREKDQNNLVWKKLDDETLRNYTEAVKGNGTVEINKEVEKSIKAQNILVLRNSDGSKIGIYPANSKELENDKNAKNEWSFNLTLTKLISPEDDKDMLSYTNSLEIMKRTNAAGRRAKIGITGNYIPNFEIKEVDSTKARRILITKPLGENHSKNIIIISIALSSSIAIGIIAIKKKRRK